MEEPIRDAFAMLPAYFKLHRYEWLGYIPIVGLLLDLLLGRYLFASMDKKSG